MAIASRSLLVHDLRGAVLKLRRHAARRVYITIRTGDGPHDRNIVEAAGREYRPGADYDVVFNLLHRMGIYANVVFTLARDDKSFVDVEDALNSMRWMVRGMTPDEDNRLLDDASGGFGEDGPVRIFGRVRRPVVFGSEELRRMAFEELNDLPIFCGTGDPKGRIASCKGVLLENVIRMAEVIREEDNDTKKTFIVLSTEDGYKTVFSWQEIFNTSVGGGVMVLFEKDGRPLSAKNGGLALVSAEDYFTGSRYVKRLASIEIRLIE